MKKVRLATLADCPGWLKLAKEVEPLFGPMVEVPGFRKALERAIRNENALCVSDVKGKSADFYGGIVVSPRKNEITWLAVAQDGRYQGIGKALLSEAINRLDKNKSIKVSTFDHTVSDGLPARRLYQSFGFKDQASEGLNPAGLPTVTMILFQ